jgi:putative Mg2+ transporter-C (MgtC) family protein
MGMRKMDWLNSDVVTTTFRLVIAAILCGLIGIEREFKKHPAGFRTHLLVGVGSCLMMILSLFGFESFLEAHPNIQGFDPSRLPAYVVSGIGFLGAGTILVHGVTVKGLTTAASIWVVAGIGLVVGIGMYFEAIFTTVIVILSLVFLNRIERIYMRRKQHQQLTIIVKNKEVSLAEIVEQLEKYNVIIKDLTVEDYEKDTTTSLIKFSFSIQLPKLKHLSELYDELQELDFVVKVFTVD